MHAVSAKPVESALGRLAPLAKLPVFLDLAGKPVAVAGGDEAVAWKAELAAAAGGVVSVYAPVPSEGLAALISRGPSAGAIALKRRRWRPQDLIGVALAIASAKDEVEARAFHDAARAAGVPVNVIDRPAFSTLQFGSIVNRSPVVVGISSNGAAPVLAQEIRRRIETVLPPALARWAEKAQSLRAEVRRRLALPAARRAFWLRFARAVFDGRPMPAIDDLADVPVPGRVTLVGAGPGDAGLLTLDAVRAMQAADVILFDDRISDEVLQLARREARKMLIGKCGERTGCRREDVDALTLRLVRAGRHVVRLLPGAALALDRSSQEIACLLAAGVEVAVAPGVALIPAPAPGPSRTRSGGLGRPTPEPPRAGKETGIRGRRAGR